jgi:hypothetical protein
MPVYISVRWQLVSALIAPLLSAPTAGVLEGACPEPYSGATGFILYSVVVRGSSESHGLTLAQHLGVKIEP